MIQCNPQGASTAPEKYVSEPQSYDITLNVCDKQKIIVATNFDWYKLA